MDSFPFTWIVSSSISDKSFIVLDHINNAVGVLLKTGIAYLS
jgi:hypothetical protein